MSTPAVYLDHAATTPLRPQAREAMLPLLDGAFGNPSSLHAFGRRARAALDDARARLAALIGASPAEIVFTRAGTEADNLAVLGRARAAPGQTLAVGATEHRAVLAAARASGARVTVLPVDGEGQLALDPLEQALAQRPALVSVMWANNETGALAPVAQIGERCRAQGIPFHSDAVQALGKVPLRVDQVAVDLLAFSAHKLGGPRGIGALYLRRGTGVSPLLHGGGQERGLRPGTEDVAGAAGFAAAAEAAEAVREADMARLGALRDRLQAGLLAALPGAVLHAAGGPRLATVCALSLPGADPQALLAALDLAGVAVSSGSACSSGAVEPSHVLLAMGVPAAVAGPSLRFSLGWNSGDADIARALEVVPEVARRVRSAD